MKKLACLLSTLILLLSVLFIAALPASAAATPEITTTAYNLILKNNLSNIYIEYKVNFANADPVKTEDKGLLLWTTPQTEYKLGNEEFNIKPTAQSDGDDIFIFTGLTAKQMATDVYSVPYAIVNGKTYYGALRKYSILQYAYNKLGKTGDSETDREDLKELLNYMLNFGGQTQQYFGYKTDRLASDDFYQVKTYFAYLPDGTTSGLYKAGKELTLKANVSATDNGTDISWTDRVGKELKKDKVASGNATYTVTVPEYNETYRAYKQYDALVFGDNVVDRNSMMDIFALLARADGMEFNFRPVTNTVNILKGGAYNFYNQIYNNPTSQGVANLRSETSTFGKALADEVFDCDYYFHLVGRDFNVLWAGSNWVNRDKFSLANFRDRLLFKNSNAKIVLISPYAYQDGSNMFESSFNYGATTSATTSKLNPNFVPPKTDENNQTNLDWLARHQFEGNYINNYYVHTRAIRNITSILKDYLNSNPTSSITSVAWIDEAFTKYYSDSKYFGTLGEELYDNVLLHAPYSRYEKLEGTNKDTGRNPSPAGAYLAACALYASTFNKTPCGIDYYGGLSEDLAKTLQNCAHEAVLGTAAPTNVVKPIQNKLRETEVLYDWEGKWGINKVEEYPAYYDELYATAMAYRDHVMFTDYDQYGLSPRAYTYNGSSLTGYTDYRREEKASPETASPQHLLHLDCSGFVYSVYKNAFNYGFTNSLGNETNQTYDMMRVGFTSNCNMRTPMPSGDASVFYYAPPNLTTDINENYLNERKKDFITEIQPGDVLVYRVPSVSGSTINGYGTGYGHTMLYLGNGQFIHCTSGNRFSGSNSDYNFAWQYDIKNPHGAIYLESIDNLLYPNQSRYLFNGKNYINLLRPANTQLAPTTDAQNRLNYLADICVYRTTSAPFGHTVSTGGTVTYTITATNNGKTEKSVTFTESLGSGLTYADSSKTGNVTLTIKPGETVNYSYGLNVTAENGTTLKPTAKAGGVTLPVLPIYVGKTLSASAQNSVKATVNALSANTELALAQAYLGSTKTSLLAIIEDYFDTFTSYHRRRNESNSYVSNSSSSSISSSEKYFYDANIGYRLKSAYRFEYPSVPGSMLVPNMHGGAAYAYYGTVNNSTDRTARIRTLTLDNFIPGDILFTVDQTYEYLTADASAEVTTAPEHTADDYHCYIYVGNNEFVTVKNGAKTSISGESDCEILLQYVHGEDLFFVLRPSLAK